jgi:hypothetical protein
VTPGIKNFDKRIFDNTVIIEFKLFKVEKVKKTTRNQRLAALHFFFRYAQGEAPSLIYHFQKVISIPVKKAEKK